MSKVVVVKYPEAEKKGRYSREEYRLILQAGLKQLSGETSTYQAVKKTIPNGTIGMKTNCLTGRFFSTPPELIDALADLLTTNNHIKDNQLVIWERTNRELKEAGYKLNASSFGRRCLGTDTNGVGYGSNFETYGEVSTRLSRIMTDTVDMNINLPVLKDHSLAGLSGGLKNMYGAICNPNKFHDNHCSPYAAHVSALETIKSKNRLTIIDAARVQYNGGPGFMSEYLADYGGIIMSTDPVSADRIGLEILERLRSENKLPNLEQAGREVKYLQIGEDIGLGTADMSKIELTVINVDQNGTAHNGGLL